MSRREAATLFQNLRQRSQFAIDNFRHQLAYIDALPQLTLLGLISGLAAALVTIAFRWSVEGSLGYLLPANSENFEALGSAWHFWLPFLGATLIGAGLHMLDKEKHQTSVGHVLDRLHNHQGKLPLGNWAVQFVGGILSLISGQSVGREGPAVHLGAGAASQLGQWLRLPHNSLRTLVGCGVAAAIAASFNTPMAGVIFAMEVVLMEYTITGFIPVILASVSGAAMAQLTFGEGVVFDVAGAQMNSLWELPYIVATGLVVALFAAAFIRLQLVCYGVKQIPVALRLSLAGLATGCVALYVPAVMGVGYDTVEAAMLGRLGLGMLLAITVAKLVVTAVSAGLGIPGGIIGPTFVVGACLGGVLGIIGNTFFPQEAAAPALYVLLGMSAMMAAVLNAPLAALIAVMELTYNPSMIFPTMLMIVVACIATRQLFGCEGIFLAQLAVAGKPVAPGPANQVLSRAGVRSVMDTRFVGTPQSLGYDEARKLLTSHPVWLVIEELDIGRYLLRAADLAAYLDSASEEELTLEKDIDLLEIPGRRYQPLPIHQQANLYEALKLLQEGAEALYVTRPSTPLISPVMGIVTRDAIDNYYQA